MVATDGSVDPFTSFGSALRFLRRRARLTQAQLAIAVGYSDAHICRIERGQRPPDLSALLALFVPALGLEQQPDLANRLLSLAAVARGEDLPSCSPLAPGPQTTASAAGQRHLPRGIRPAVARRIATVTQALSVFPTTFVGREQNLLAIRNLLEPNSGVRLLTLIGPPGAGKTRLALEVAAQLGALYPDGSVFVGLAALRDPALVPTALAHVLGVREAAGQGIPEGLLTYLAGKRLLLVLDNFEHLLAATSWLTEVLAGCPALRVLVTSRTPLRLRGEHEYPVPPLALPPPTSWGTIEALARNPAVELFIQRAQAVRPDFALTTANAGAVAGIVRRLDGLPLAIELAAARVKVLTASTLLMRLEHPLDLLVDGARDLPPRQQTLRRTLEWSCSLLEPDELLLFRRLAVFAGGGTLEAIGAVCAGTELSTDRAFTLLARLVDHSLVQADLAAEEPRYRLLETTLEYATEQLAEAGETDCLRRRHRDWCLALAEQAELELSGPHQHAWLARLARELENMQAALAWCRDADAAGGLRTAVALVPFWERRGIVAGGRRMLEGLLARAPADAPQRGRALLGAGILAAAQGDWPAARALLEESLARCRESGDRGGTAWALLRLGDVAMADDALTLVQACYAESLRLFQALGDARGVAWVHYYAGFLSRIHADYAQTRALWQQSLAGFRASGDLRGVGAALSCLAQVAALRAEYASAQVLLHESLTLERAGGNKPAIAWTLSLLGNLARIQGDAVSSRTLLDESLTLFEEMGDQRKIGVVVHHLGNVAAASGDLSEARNRYETSLGLYRATNDVRNVARVLGDLANLHDLEGEGEQARALWLESLRGFRDSGTNRWGMSWTLGNLGMLAIRQGDGMGGVQRRRGGGSSPRVPQRHRSRRARRLCCCPRRSPFHAGRGGVRSGMGGRARDDTGRGGHAGAGYQSAEVAPRWRDLRTRSPPEQTDPS